MKVIDLNQFRARKAIRELERRIELNILYPVKGSAREIKEAFSEWLRERKAVSN
jgi:hypothetical protein